MDKQRQSIMDVAAIFMIAAFILLGVFGRTVLTGKEISKLPVLASEDQFFNNDIRLAVPRPRFDPSLFQFHVPSQLYVQEELKHGRLPLWNPSFGCGFPTFAELQYCTFSPFRIVFQASNAYLYNLGIVVKSLIGALGTFWLCRQFGFSPGAGTFAGIAYAISPFILRELELPNEVQFIPLIAAAFLFLTNRKSLLKVSILGACTAIALASMHPEFFFLSILNALLTLIVARFFQQNQNLADLSKNVVLAGVIGIGLGAPLLLPFIELLCTSDSYKFHTSIVQFVQIKTLLAGLVTPVCGGGSAFVGAVSIVVALFAVTYGGRRGAALFALVFFLTLWASLPGPLEHLAAVRPFSLIPPRYLLAPMLLSICLLAAFGIELLAEKMEKRRWQDLLPLAIYAAIVAAVPFILSNGGLSLPGFDGTLPPPAALKPEAIAGLISLIVMGAAILAAYLLNFPFKLSIFLPVCLIAANLISLGNSSKTALGPTFAFNFRSTGAIEYLQNTGERMVASGKAFFAPNISMVYGLRDFRANGPLLPSSISKLQNIREKEEESESNSFLFSAVNNLASVSYLLSRWPKYAAEGQALPMKAFPALGKLPKELVPGVKLRDGNYCLSTNGELFAEFTWQQTGKIRVPLAAELDIVDKDGKLLAQGQRIPIFLSNSEIGIQRGAVKVPKFKTLKQDAYAILRMISCLNEAAVPFDSANLPTRALGIDLLKVSNKQDDLADLSKADLQLVLEDQDDVLVYKNNNALPQAYLSKVIWPASDADNAATLLKQPRFDPRTATIIEASPSQVQLQTADRGTSTDLKSATVSRQDPHTVTVKYSSNDEAFLILTDTFYSGWRAYLDNKEIPIYRANVAFRAVKVPAGEHTVNFIFIPLSFYGGLIIAIATAMIALFCCIRSKKAVNA